MENYIESKAMILQVPFDSLTKGQALETLMQYLEGERNHLVVTPNPECVMLAQRNPKYLHILQNADLVLADGIGIVIAARLLKLPIPERVPGCDTTQALMRVSKGKKVYLLGSAPGVAETAMKKLRSQEVNVVGAHDGYFDNETETDILYELQTLKPDMLIVGMGMPKQEEWTSKHLHTLPCKITLCLGGSIDIFAGKVRRAPKIMRKIGLEWLYRLISNPWRAKRMLDLPRFILAVLRTKT